MATRRISVDFIAGTGTFTADVDRAKTKIQQFGKATQDVGTAGKGTLSVWTQKAAALKVLEGNLGGANRALVLFLGKLGFGPILEAAFPVAGALLFGATVLRVGEKIHEFLKQVEQTPARLNAAFHEANDGAFASLNSLRVEGDKLDNQIARLLGKHQNYLKLELDEGAEAAGKLGEALAKDSEKITQFLEKEGPSWWEKASGWVGSIMNAPGQMMAEAVEWSQSGKVSRPNEVNFKREFGDKNVPGKYREDLANIRQRMQDEVSKAQIAGNLDQERLARQKGIADLTSRQGQELRNIVSWSQWASDNDKKRLEIIRQYIASQQLETQAREANTEKQERQTELEIKAANLRTEKPEEKAMAELQATIGEAQAKLAAIGKSPMETARLEAEAIAKKHLADLNEQERRYNPTAPAGADLLGASYRSKYTAGVVRRAEITETAKLAEALYGETVKTKQQAAASDLMAAAVSRGYDATRKARIESELMAQMGKRYGTAEGSEEQAARRKNITLALDAKHNEELATTLQRMREEVALERDLAAAQAGGADAIQAAQVRNIWRRGLQNGQSGTAIAAEIQAYLAKQDVSDAKELASANQKIAAMKALAAAGSEKQRREIEAQNAYNEALVKTGNEEVAAAAAEEVRVKYQEQIATEASKMANTFTDQLAKIKDIVTAIKAQEAATGRTWQAEIALRDLENERLKIFVQMQLKQDSLNAGVRAFFTEMQEEAKKASQVVYDALNSALDKASDEFAKFATGQKTNWSGMLKSIGQQMVKESIKSGLQRLLGLAGKGKRGQSPSAPLYVHEVGNKSTPGGGQDGDQSDASGSSQSSGGIGGFIKSLIKKLLHIGNIGSSSDSSSGDSGGGGGGDDGSGDAGGIADAAGGGGGGDDFGGFMAGGGSAQAGMSYVVGDGGEPEILTMGRSSGRITPFSKAGMGGDTYITVDARNSELGAENRIKRAIEASHQQAIVTSVRATADREHRMPRRSHHRG